MQQRQKQSVILVGMMASGKSTVGAERARRLGWDFFDTDEVIAKEKGKPVSQIFAEEKVPYYMALDIETGNTIYLKKDETELITKFRSLSDDNQKIIIGFLDANSR